MKYFLIAGEASGDLHASNLMSELKKQDSQAEFCFLGGDLMAAQGGLQIKHYRDMAFMGFFNVLLNIRKVIKNLSSCKKELLRFNPDALILVDYPSFNLRIAKFAKRKLNAIVYYYISPKIWAWKEYRIKAIKKHIDKMFCILPFEVDFYKRHDYKVDYVGNPTMDSVTSFIQKNKTSENDFRKENGLDGRPLVALLAGSRKQEIKKCLPTMLNMASHFPNHQFVVAGAPGIEASFYEKLSNGNAPVLFSHTYALVKNAKAAIVNSGTATLETALLNTPEVVVYHVFGGKFTSWLKGKILHVPYVSLVNLIAGKEIVKELVAHLFTEDNLKKETNLLLTDNAYIEKQLIGYQKVAETLGTSGCAVKTASVIFNDLQK